MAGISVKTTEGVVPQCYAYTTPGVARHEGWTKIGFTERDVDVRIREQTHTAGIEYKLWWSIRAAFMTPPYNAFRDTDFHGYLERLDVRREKDTEWFFISPERAKGDFRDFVENHGVVEDARATAAAYVLRDEQEEAVKKAMAHFRAREGGEFLWNCKPRFGKTLAAYDLCARMGARNVLVLTNRPAIANSWYDDYETFFGPKSGWLFVSGVEGIRDRRYVLDRKQFVERATALDGGVKGCIEFVSLQDLKGSIHFGGTYDKLEELSAERGVTWDVMIVDEAHEGVDTYKTDVAFGQIRRRHTLHLSGTPFKALANEKFAESAIFNWTYADEQRRKREWDDSRELENPYANLPRLTLYTYRMSEIVRDRAARGVALADGGWAEHAFDLNEFFRVNESTGRFAHESDVDSFLDALASGERFPFSTPELRDELRHTFWLLDRVAAAKALAKKLKVHPVFGNGDYEIVLAAGDGRLDDADESEKAFNRVTEAIRRHPYTITLSVGQLTTGVTVPEWTAVLMLSNVKSPALYMQAAFRAQNPCLFQDAKGGFRRKRDAYVFDFDPARTLTIFEAFANDLIPETSGEKGGADERKRHVRELLNFFPVYGEGAGGEMVVLDAEEVLSIPRRIHAKEVVERGFMSNFLFANVSGIFNAPKEIVDLINGMQAIEAPRRAAAVEVDDGTVTRLGLNEDGEVEVPEERVVGLAADIFGDKVYAEVGAHLDAAADVAAESGAGRAKKDELAELRETFGRPVADALVAKAKEHYGAELRGPAQRRLEMKVRETTDRIVRVAYGEYAIRDRKLEKEGNDRIAEARRAGASMHELTAIGDECARRRHEARREMVVDIQTRLKGDEGVRKAAETIAETVETERRRTEKDTIESSVRDHLRGFSRTIPAFLMAYGDETTTLANFDTLVPAEVFWEVTANPQTGKGVTLEQFRMLRDGGDYYQRDERGNEIRDEAHRRHFVGGLFDEVVFNDAVQEFMKRRAELANYFEDDGRGDIFDYVPPQRTNQIFTPRAVVKDMVDRLEAENPGCFDDPDATFADLYVKSGMYVAEIVKRLYRSEKMKALFPDGAERLRHIFEKQVYACAPTEIIHRICLRYVLGFKGGERIGRHNVRRLDTLAAAQSGTLDAVLRAAFPGVGSD